MGRMSEIWQDQQERENESGSDDFAAWVAAHENEYKELHRTTETVQTVSAKPIAQRNCANPF